MKKDRTLLVTLAILVILTVNVLPQSGGTFTITKSVIAGGGGSNSTGGTFTVSGTMGQAAAGELSVGGQYSLASEPEE